MKTFSILTIPDDPRWLFKRKLCWIIDFKEDKNSFIDERWRVIALFLYALYWRNLWVSILNNQSAFCSVIHRHKWFFLHRLESWNFPLIAVNTQLRTNVSTYRLDLEAGVFFRIFQNRGKSPCLAYLETLQSFAVIFNVFATLKRPSMNSLIKYYFR